MNNKQNIQVEAVDSTLIDMAKKDDRIVVLTADMADRIVPRFAREMKKKFFNFGISEQGMIGAAAGMAKSGLIPFVTTLAVFLSMRTCEQIRTDLAYARSNVKIIASGGGLVYGTLGPTHQGLEDISIMRSISGLVVMAPADCGETAEAVKAAGEFDGPVYIRLGKGKVPAIHTKDSLKNFKIGKAIKLVDGNDVSIIATGVMVSKAIEASDILKSKGIKASVYSMHTLKPVDIACVMEASNSRFGILTVEDNNICGGLGEAVSAIITSKKPVKVFSLGIPDKYPIIGEPEDLYRYYEMGIESIVKKSIKLTES